MEGILQGPITLTANISLAGSLTMKTQESLAVFSMPGLDLHVKAMIVVEFKNIIFLPNN